MNDPQMPLEARQKFAEHLRTKLNSHRTVFVVDKFMFEPQEAAPSRVVAHDTMMAASRGAPVKTVSAAALRLLLDYCENDWPMGFVEYCAAIFHSREPREGETAFDLLPDQRSRMSGERLGFGDKYGSNEP